MRRGGEEGLAHDALDGGSDENGLIGERNDFELGRDVGQNSWQRSLHLVDDRQRGSFAIAGNGHENAAGAIGTNDVLLWLKAVANLGDIFDVDRRAVDGSNRKIVQLFKDAGTAVDADLVFGAGELGGSGRQDEVLQVDARSRRRWARVASRRVHRG